MSRPHSASASARRSSSIVLTTTLIESLPVSRCHNINIVPVETETPDALRKEIRRLRPRIWKAIAESPNIRQKVVLLQQRLKPDFDYGAAATLIEILDYQIATLPMEETAQDSPTVLDQTTVFSLLSDVCAARIEAFGPRQTSCLREIQLKLIVTSLLFLQCLGVTHIGESRRIAFLKDLSELQVKVMEDLKVQTQKGDLRSYDSWFLIQFAKDELNSLQSSRGRWSRFAAGLLNISFAAGYAYTTNGRELMQALDNAFHAVSKDPNKNYNTLSFISRLTLVAIALNYKAKIEDDDVSRRWARDIAGAITGKIVQEFESHPFKLGMLDRLSRTAFDATAGTGYTVGSSTNYFPYGLLYLLHLLVETFPSVSRVVDSARTLAQRLIHGLEVEGERGVLKQYPDVLRHKALEIFIAGRHGTDRDANEKQFEKLVEALERYQAEILRGAKAKRQPELREQYKGDVRLLREKFGPLRAFCEHREARLARVIVDAEAEMRIREERPTLQTMAHSYPPERTITAAPIPEHNHFQRDPIPRIFTIDEHDHFPRPYSHSPPPMDAAMERSPSQPRSSVSTGTSDGHLRPLTPTSMPNTPATLPVDNPMATPIYGSPPTSTLFGSPPKSTFGSPPLSSPLTPSTTPQAANAPLTPSSPRARRESRSNRNSSANIAIADWKEDETGTFNTNHTLEKLKARPAKANSGFLRRAPAWRVTAIAPDCHHVAFAGMTHVDVIRINGSGSERLPIYSWKLSKVDEKAAETVLDVALSNAGRMVVMTQHKLFIHDFVSPSQPAGNVVFECSSTDYEKGSKWDHRCLCISPDGAMIVVGLRQAVGGKGEVGVYRGKLRVFRRVINSDEYAFSQDIQPPEMRTASGSLINDTPKLLTFSKDGWTFASSSVISSHIHIYSAQTLSLISSGRVQFTHESGVEGITSLTILRRRANYPYLITTISSRTNESTANTTIMPITTPELPPDKSFLRFRASKTANCHGCTATYDGRALAVLDKFGKISLFITRRHNVAGLTIHHSGHLSEELAPLTGDSDNKSARVMFSTDGRKLVGADREGKILVCAFTMGWTEDMGGVPMPVSPGVGGEIHPGAQFFS